MHICLYGPLGNGNWPWMSALKFGCIHMLTIFHGPSIASTNVEAFTVALVYSSVPHMFLATVPTPSDPIPIPPMENFYRLFFKKRSFKCNLTVENKPNQVLEQLQHRRGKHKKWTVWWHHAEALKNSLQFGHKTGAKTWMGEAAAPSVFSCKSKTGI